jgi:menaquinone-dependent protoporphyrinogen oxidase
MKTLIIYMSHHGTTRKVVDRLESDIGTEHTQSIDLGKNDAPDLSDAETIIIGGSIHMGQIQSKIKRFCELQKEVLLKKRLGLFLCFMNEELGVEEFNNAYPAELRNHAIAHGLFGGELLMDKMNFIEKFIIRIVAKETRSVSRLNYPAIDRFIQVMR